MLSCIFTGMLFGQKYDPYIVIAGHNDKEKIGHNFWAKETTVCWVGMG